MGLFGIATNSVQMLVLVAVLTVAVFAVLYFEKFRYEVEGIRIYRKDSKKSWTNLLLVLAAALLVKLIFAAAYEGHGTDMTCFSAWSDMIFKDGFGISIIRILLRIIRPDIWQCCGGLGLCAAFLIWMLQQEPEDVLLN